MLNKAQIIGYVGRDPEIRYTAGGDPIAHVSVATSETWKDKASGERKDRTEWHRVVLFGKVAEIASQYVRKGALVYIEGKLQTRKWQGSDGVERYTTEILVDSFGGTMRMLGGKGDAPPANDNAPTPAQDSAPPQRRPAAPAQAVTDLDDDIPF